MPIKTDLNVSPYFDDFDANNNYTRILFRPATAVQARELTQIQSMLQNQIEKFGDWAFKNGDIVSGCTISDIPRFPYVRLQDYQTNSASFDVNNLLNTQAVSSTSNLTARILYANTGLSANYPDTNIVYLQYINTGVNGEQYFSNNEQLTFYTIPRTGNNTADTVAIVNSYANTTANTYAIGNGHGVSVSEGVVYLNGNFVKVLEPNIGIVNAYGIYAGNASVGYVLSEQIITENQDSSLLDNALGYSNENAPGAHRLQLTPTLICLSQEEAAQTASFNPLAVYSFGSIVSSANSTSDLSSIVGDIVANRTYEESGNYVVNPFAVDSVTNVYSSNNEFSISSNNVFARINPGSGYALGKRVELKSTKYVTLRRGIDTQVNKSQQITFNYGSYFIINDVAGTFDFSTAQTVKLYNLPQKAITNRGFSSLTPQGNNIGTAQVRCFSYNGGTQGSNSAQYLLHVFNVQISNGYNVNQIKSVYYDGTKKAAGDVISDGLIRTSDKPQLFKFGVNGLKNLRDSSNNNNSNFFYRQKASTTMGTGGNVTITITSSPTGGVDILPFGTGVLADADASTFNLIVTANSDSSALTGTVTVLSTNTIVTGSSTAFLTQLDDGDQIKVGSDIRTIFKVINATALAVDSPFTSNSSGSTFYKTYVAGKILPIVQTLRNIPSYINVTNSTSFTIVSGQAPSSSVNVDVIYDVYRTGAVPANKKINKNRFVKINTTTHSAGNKGPWTIGMSDVHKLTKVYASSNGTYTTSGADVTRNFVFSSGQKDTHYDLGYLYVKPGYDVSVNPYLLVQFDYFSVNTTPGSGFFTVESYPIDDANTANTNAIQTKDIPLYIDEAGRRDSLKDYLDFRIPCSNTAADTGSIDISNTSQVTSAISSATVNPSSTLTLTTSPSLIPPSFSQNFEADITYYLPRQDLIYITPDGSVKVKEGLSSAAPQTPLSPENSMAVAVINIPAYPSLSSDQVDVLLSINQSSISVVRDTSLSISSNIITNRRYTMKDIGRLDQRITNLEYYTQLSLLEKKATDMTITDGNGLNRFKNGIFVETFGDFTQSEVSNPEYSIAIDKKKGYGRPRIVREFVDIEFSGALTTINNSANTNGRNFYVDTTYNVQKTGRVITLPYDEVPFMVQPYATKYRAASKVAYAWNGKAVLIPSYDNAYDVNNTGSLNITVDASAPWKDFAQSPFGSIWGDWQSVANTTVNTVLTGSVISGTSNIHVTWMGSDAQAKETVLKYIHNIYGNNFVLGNITVSYGTNWSAYDVMIDPSGNYYWNNWVNPFTS